MSRPQSAAASGPRRTEVDPARAAAFDVLRTVRVEKAYTNLVLPAVIRHYKLTGRDAAFTTELASGSIRMRGTYDAIIAACADRPLTKIEARVLDALAPGRAPAPVDAGARRTRRSAPPWTSCTCAVARARPGSPTRCCARSPSTTSTSGSPRWRPTSAPRRPSTSRSPTATPSGWSTSCAPSSAPSELPALLAADNVAPTVTLVARPGRVDARRAAGRPDAVLAVRHGAAQRRPRRREGGGPGPRRGPGRGLAAGRARPRRRHRSRDRTCAGSTCAPDPAASRPCWPGSPPSAARRSSPTSRRRTGAGWSPGRSTAPTAWPASSPPTAPGRRTGPAASTGSWSTPRAPGLGALRRRPEARWARKTDDLVALVMLQRQLVNAALDLVRPGRRAALRHLLAGALRDRDRGQRDRPDAPRRRARGRVRPAAQVPDCAGPVPGTLQLWPHRHGTDAMFMALFRRTEA